MLNHINAANLILKTLCTEMACVVFLVSGLLWLDKKLALKRAGDWIWMRIKEHAVREAPGESRGSEPGIVGLSLDAMFSSWWALLYLALTMGFLGACLIAICLQPPLFPLRALVGCACMAFCAFWVRSFYVDFRIAIDKIDRL